MDETAVYKDDNSRESGAVPPETVSVSSLAGPSRTYGACSPEIPVIVSTAWDSIAQCLPSPTPLWMGAWPSEKPLPDHSVILLALNERLRLVADSLRHRKPFDARDAAYQVEFLGKLLRLGVVKELNEYINPTPKRAGVFVTDAEVG